MPRLRNEGWRYERNIGAILDLFIGPTEGVHGMAREQLQVAWRVEREGIMRGQKWPPGTRPWAWFGFDLGEEPPKTRHAEAVRLAELGVLEDWEVAALREKAVEAGLRVSTDSEHYTDPGEHHKPGYYPDRKAVALWKDVETALAQRTP